MRAAGLTHGGFYAISLQGSARFRACSQAAQSLASGLKSQIEGKPPDQALPLLVGKYLSRSHRDRPAIGCVLAALGVKLARADAKTREAATEGFLGLSPVDCRTAQERVRQKGRSAVYGDRCSHDRCHDSRRIVPDSRISKFPS